MTTIPVETCMVSGFFVSEAKDDDIKVTRHVTVDTVNCRKVKSMSALALSKAGLKHYLEKS